MAVSAVMSGLLFTNLSAITAAASYGIPQSNSTSKTATLAGRGSDATSSTSSQALFLMPTNLSGGIATSGIQNGSSTVLAVPQPSKLDVWLDTLALKESGGRADIRILDTDGNYAYGCLQFHMATFKAYTQRYGLESATTTAGWLAKLYNCPLQKKVAKRMIQENYTNWHAWGYTVRYKTGLPPIDTADIAVNTPSTVAIISTK